MEGGQGEHLGRMWRGPGEWLHLCSGVDGKRAGVEGRTRSLWLTRQLEILEDPEQGMATNVGVGERNVVPKPDPTWAVSLLPEPALRKRQGGVVPQSGGLS